MVKIRTKSDVNQDKNLSKLVIKQDLTRSNVGLKQVKVKTKLGALN